LAGLLDVSRHASNGPGVRQSALELSGFAGGLDYNPAPAG
jgi:hypothetical protein